MTKTPQLIEEQILDLVACNPDGILVVDAAGVIRFANAAAAHLFGRGADELRGQPFGFPLAAGEFTEIEIIHKSSNIRFVEMRTVNIPWEGKDCFLASLREITHRKHQEEELRNLTLKDELTGLHNRRGFMTLAEQRLRLSRRSGDRVLLLYADLDGLKGINDTLGHVMGDCALVDVAEILNRTFRKADIIARIGGDEFAVLVSETSVRDSGTLRNRLTQKISIHNAAVNRGYQVSLSMGIVCVDPSSPAPLQELLRCADVEMYREKRASRRGDR